MNKISPVTRKNLFMCEIAEKSPQQQFDGETTMGAVITL
jgi:hypothetical protein